MNEDTGLYHAKQENICILPIIVNHVKRMKCLNCLRGQDTLVLQRYLTYIPRILVSLNTNLSLVFSKTCVFDGFPWFVRFGPPMHEAAVVPAGSF